MKWLFSIVAFLVIGSATAQQTLKFVKGMVITQSATFEKEAVVYAAGTSNDSGVVTISGNNIVVDFNSLHMLGDSGLLNPDEFTGCAVYIKGGNNITIRNLRVSRYAIAIRAENVSNLRVENCEVTDLYRKRLLSNWQREDISDWMSFHQNERQEWLRYGAAFYLFKCNNAIIRNNTVRNSQCALMMTRCDSARVYNNRFIFNSAIGIGMYRCSFNQVLYNQLDFNVRGYSHGFYWRGQDSAGILVFEQCSNNAFVGNSATHSGDGFFLWAGQTTMDTGKGGCNDNLLLDNDFSYSPTNGIEATFSRNVFIGNKVVGCDHGLWGGYSYNSHIEGNQFGENRIGIAIEHGNNISINRNRFEQNKTAIRLWARPTQPDDWAYPKFTDTRSRKYCIGGNTYNGDSVVYDLSLTDSLQLDFNKKSFSNNHTILKRTGEAIVIDTLKKDSCKNVHARFEVDLIGVDTQFVNRKLPVGGRESIRMLEWGPYDYRQPMARLIKIGANGMMHIEFLGFPEKFYQVDSLVGIGDISSRRGRFPDTVLVRPAGQYVKLFWSSRFVDDSSAHSPAAGQFVFEDFELRANWTTHVYPFQSVDSLRSSGTYFNKITAKTKAIPVVNSKPDFVWWRSPGNGIPSDSFVTVATTTIEVPADNYRLAITADDMVRLFVDGKLLIDHWNKPAAKYDDELQHETLLSLGGKHNIRIEHAEVTGLSVLQFYLKPLGHPFVKNNRDSND